MWKIWHNLVNKCEGIPWGIVINVYAIILIGLINLYSATLADTTSVRFYDQIQWLILGTMSMIFWGILLDLRTIERFSMFGYVIICLLLLAVDIFGQTTKGAQRWLAIGSIRLQPSELAKFAMILVVAKSFTWSRGLFEHNLFSLWRQVLVLSFPTALILIQPDLGTAGLILMITGLQFFFVRINKKSLVIAASLSISAVLIGWNFLYPYQKSRVLNFLNPMNDQRGSNYQLIQSMIAVGSGGMWGKGYRRGTQSQLSFLPERHTDFIFSVFSEEHGFVGGVILIVLLSILVVQILRMVEKSRDTYSALVAVGVAGFFIFHSLINITMVLGLFPVVGVPLSLVSYGGSHMLTAMSCIGLLIAVEKKRSVSVTM